MNPKDENKVIGLGKLNEVSNSSWECRVSKKDKEAQRKQMGLEEVNELKEVWKERNSIPMGSI